MANVAMWIVFLSNKMMTNTLNKTRHRENQSKKVRSNPWRYTTKLVFYPMDYILRVYGSSLVFENYYNLGAPKGA